MRRCGSARAAFPPGRRTAATSSGSRPGSTATSCSPGCNESCVTHGPGLARIAAELVTTGACAADISAYRVDRFEGLDTATVQVGAEGQYLMRHPPAEGVAATPFGIELS